MPALAEPKTETIEISLEVGCDCGAQLGRDLYVQLTRGHYSDGMAVLPLEGTFDEYLAKLRTGRKRSAKATGAGYVVRRFERAHWTADIFKINTSREQRQGRPMSDGYRTPPA